jgi:hypothetical protein
MRKVLRILVGMGIADLRNLGEVCKERVPVALQLEQSTKLIGWVNHNGTYIQRKPLYERYSLHLFGRPKHRGI